MLPAFKLELNPLGAKQCGQTSDASTNSVSSHVRAQRTLEAVTMRHGANKNLPLRPVDNAPWYQFFFGGVSAVRGRSEHGSKQQQYEHTPLPRRRVASLAGAVNLGSEFDCRE